MKSGKVQCFEQLLVGRTVQSDSWLDEIRVDALARARALNFPSDRDDNWRFTDLSSLYAHAFHPVDRFAHLSLNQIEQYLIPGSIRLVFVDGSYSADLSDTGNAGEDLVAASLAECFGDGMVEETFGQYAPYENDAFVALNTNFFEDGAWVHVKSDVAAPIHILHIATRRETPAAIYPRGMLMLESHSRATIVEEFVGLDAGVYLSDAVTEVVVKDGATLHHVRLQREDTGAFHIGQCSVTCGKDSVYEATSLALGARVSRHGLQVTQQSEGAEIHLNGLALISGRQIADTHTRINHAAPHGKSVQLHKCIADGSAHAVFSGKIIVQPGSSGTDSGQSSRNLLLSDKAHIDTQPQLEIFNDDVSCKHGATIGQIDADALFFLKSRGLNEDRARSLLTHAFAAEVIDRIPVPFLVESLNKSILEKMGGTR